MDKDTLFRISWKRCYLALMSSVRKLLRSNEFKPGTDASLWLRAVNPESYSMQVPVAHPIVAQLREQGQLLL